MLQEEKADDPHKRQAKLAEFLTGLTVPKSKYPGRRRNACLDITALCEDYAKYVNSKEAQDDKKSAREDAVWDDQESEASSVLSLAKGNEASKAGSDSETGSSPPMSPAGGPLILSESDGR